MLPIREGVKNYLTTFCVKVHKEEVPTLTQVLVNQIKYQVQLESIINRMFNFYDIFVLNAAIYVAIVVANVTVGQWDKSLM